MWYRSCSFCRQIVCQALSSVFQYRCYGRHGHLLSAILTLVFYHLQPIIWYTLGHLEATLFKWSMHHLWRLTNCTNCEPIMSWTRLNFEAGMFKITIISNSQVVMTRPLELNSFTSIWCTIYANDLLQFNIREFLKLIEIACVQVLGSIKDERMFTL